MTRQQAKALILPRLKHFPEHVSNAMEELARRLNADFRNMVDQEIMRVLTRNVPPQPFFYIDSEARIRDDVIEGTIIIDSISSMLRVADD